MNSEEAKNTANDEDIRADETGMVWNRNPGLGTSLRYWTSVLYNLCSQCEHHLNC